MEGGVRNGIWATIIWLAVTWGRNMSVATSEIATAGTGGRNGGPRGFGEHRPRYCWIPEHDASIGLRAVEFCKEVGLTLDPWQETILEASLNESGDHWTAREVGLIMPRQNGKNEILLARQLVGLYLLNERLIIHSAQEWPTAMEAFGRLRDVIEDSPALMQTVARKGISMSHGNEGVTLANGQRIRFRTRTGPGGRGFTADCVMFDEAMYLSEMFYGALRPTILARPNTQIWLTGSAVDREVHEHGVVLARLRERGIANEEEIAYFEYSMEGENPDLVSDEQLEDPGELRKANPAADSRIDIKNLLSAKRSMSRRSFAVECGGIGDYPRTDGLEGVVITPEAWEACLDENGTITGPLCFCLDADPIRAHSAVCVAGLRDDGLIQVEVCRAEKGTGWVVDYVVGRVAEHKPLAVVLDGMSGSFSLLPDLTEKLKDEGLLSGLKAGEVVVLSSRENGQAASMLYDAVDQQTVRHRGQPEVSDALRGAAKSDMTDAWRWSRKDSSVNITPLVGCTLAHWAIATADLGEPHFYAFTDEEVERYAAEARR